MTVQAWAKNNRLNITTIGSPGDRLCHAIEGRALPIKISHDKKSVTRRVCQYKEYFADTDYLLSIYIDQKKRLKLKTK